MTEAISYLTGIKQIAKPPAGTRYDQWGKSAGFTLIELMLVIAIMGILAAIAIPMFSHYRVKGYDSQALADAKNFYSSATLGAANATAALTYNANNPPPGYTGAPPVSGAFTYTPGAGIVCDALFRHRHGKTGYLLDQNGNITRAP